jgi:hypothetical protein
MYSGVPTAASDSVSRAPLLHLDDAQVGQHWVAIRREKDIAGLNVAVHEPGAVRVVQRLRLWITMCSAWAISTRWLVVLASTSRS